MEENYFSSSRNLTDNHSYMNKFKSRNGSRIDDSGKASDYVKLKKMTRRLDQFLKEKAEGKGATSLPVKLHEKNNYEKYKETKREMQAFSETDELYFKMDDMPKRDFDKCWKLYEKGEISKLYKYARTYSRNTQVDI